MESIAEKSREEIENLKKEWLFDPIWDIEHTEGFESHFEELKEFRLERKKKIEEENLSKLKQRAIKLGIPDRLDLVKYFESLEDQIEIISIRIGKIEGN